VGGLIVILQSVKTGRSQDINHVEDRREKSEQNIHLVDQRLLDVKIKVKEVMGKNKINFLKQLKASFFQWLSTGFFALLLTSCGSFTHTSYRVESVLAITEKGDTIAVPLREFERQKYDTYTRFNYNNRWYWNNWRYGLIGDGSSPFLLTQTNFGGVIIFAILILAGVIAHLVDRRFNQTKTSKTKSSYT
jgi:hypothetical protein